MKKKIFNKGLSTFAVVLLCLAAVNAKAAMITVTPNVTGPLSIGQQFTVDLVASGFTGSITGGSIGDVTFNSTTAGLLGGITLNPVLTVINHYPFSPIFNNTGTLDGTGAILQGLRMGALGGLPIADGTSLATLTFQASAVGFIDILISPFGWSDSVGNPIDNLQGAIGAAGATVQVSAVPVPPAMLLFASALAGLGISGRRKIKA